MRTLDIGPPEPPLDNRDTPYTLDPHRGVDATDSDTNAGMETDPNAKMETDASEIANVNSGVMEEESSELELTNMTPEY